MKEILEKMSSYNIFTNLLPGIIFCVAVEKAYGHSAAPDDPLTAAFVYYFIGLLISRIGSILVEPALQVTGLNKYAPYSEYRRAAKLDPKLEELVESNNTYRSTIALSVCLAGYAGFEHIAKSCKFPSESKFLIAIALLAILSIVSYVKQSNYIRQRVAQRISESKQINNDSKS
ncbi:MAG: hypothetical protein IPG43_10355 [Proteobacteria bacterium]|nr:hypothetical protein [Pseudomonadota bacterium]